MQFLPAEQVLGSRLPAELQGHMLPVGMKFYTVTPHGEKLLSKPPRKRGPGEEFPFPCKVCGQPGHEAFECNEEFMWNGAPAKSFRRLHNMLAADGRPVCDQHGNYE